MTTIFTPSTKREEDGVCEFESKRGAMIDSLRIEVITIADIPKEFAAFLAHCSRNAPHLRGIGNDAVVCASQATRAEVVSRVREHALLVRASSNSKTTGSQRLQEQARTAAEQTAGNLF
ncbi:MAG TPA: hypothetical protein VHZ55_08545 [Bryobacteraceae bacterium]|nr:hypothetical protein [Bryobacteraceae bacterium]